MLWRIELRVRRSATAAGNCKDVSSPIDRAIIAASPGQVL